MRQFIVHILCIGFLLLVFLHPAKAQMIYDTLQLSELEILALKTDYSSTIKTTNIDTLLKQDLDHLGLAELLAAYTPIYVKSYGRGGLATASFRGTSASHTQVLWNDFRINSPMLGQVDLSLIPNSFFDNIEIFYGGGTLTRTSGALGGSVNLTNASGFYRKPLFRFEQSIGSYHSYSTNAALNLKSEKFGSDTRIDYQSSKNDFSYYNNAILPPETMTQENADFSNVGFTQQFSYQVNPGQLITFCSWNQWNRRNIPAIMTNVGIGGEREEYQKDFSSRNILSWRYLKGKSVWEVKAAYFFEDQQYYMKTTTNDDSAHIVSEVDSKNRTNSLFTKARYEQDLSNGFSVAAGIDVNIERVKTSNYQNTAGRNTVGLFGSLSKNFRERLKLSLLIRGEMADEEILPLMPLFGVNYKLMKVEDLYIRASVSRNYHLPTLNDLYWYPGGNEDLKPEDGFEVEGGFNYAKRFGGDHVFSANISIYASRINNWIQWVPGDYRYWSPENINQVFARGSEISVRMDGKRNQFSYKIFAEYAYTLTTNEQGNNNEQNVSEQQLIYIPEHTANGFLFGSIKGYYLSWSLNFVGERSTTMDTENSYSGTIPSYLLNDLALGKRWSFTKMSLEISGKVNNIFDADYQAILWRAMPGRNYEIILKFNIK